MFSWSYFQVRISFTIIGSIASSTLKFKHSTRHKVVSKRFLKRKTFGRFLWFWKTNWILQQPNVFFEKFLKFSVVWMDNSPRKGKKDVKFFFSATRASAKDNFPYFSTSKENFILGWLLFKKRLNLIRCSRDVNNKKYNYTSSIINQLKFPSTLF